VSSRCSYNKCVRSSIQADCPTGCRKVINGVYKDKVFLFILVFFIYIIIMELKCVLDVCNTTANNGNCFSDCDNVDGQCMFQECVRYFIFLFFSFYFYFD
jgi:hypothetical protein